MPPAALFLTVWTIVIILPAPSAPPAGWFADVTERSGLRFVHAAGIDQPSFMPASVGSGAAFLDFDNDGRPDIYLIQNAPRAGATNRLYKQQPDGTFRDVSKGSGLDVSGYGMGAAAGDVNNDGWVDLAVSEYGKIRMFVNNRNGTFTEVTKAAGLDNPLWGTSLTFVDYDRDGWLDLAVANYVEYKPQTICNDNAGKRDFCGPNNFPGTASRLFHNLGGRAAKASAPVRFEDVTLSSGLAKRKGNGLGVVAADFTGDRWPDILIANDGEPNSLWVNHHDGTFTEEAAIRGIAYDAMGRPQANMGIAVGDVNNDGLFDILITHLTTELHVAWMQGPAGRFQDRTGVMGLGRPKWRSTGFGAAFADFNQDGALDLAIVNGRVRRMDQLGKAPAKEFWEPYFERNQLFANDGSGHFVDVSEENKEFSEPAGVSRGLAVADVDGDGALDLLVTRVASAARLFKNVAAGRGHWLKIRAIDPALGGRDAYGAEITVRAGAKSWKRLINPGFSYLTSNAPEAHFGLGSAARVDGITVIWPDGSEEPFAGGRADQAMVLRKGASKRK